MKKSLLFLPFLLLLVVSSFCIGLFSKYSLLGIKYKIMGVKCKFIS